MCSGLKAAAGPASAQLRTTQARRIIHRVVVLTRASSQTQAHFFSGSSFLPLFSGM
ncbi:MAG: hypothetical protein KatS3mg122_0378 [Caldimonas sp.]|nr:MAG: hypothetical protein KatS3mg122_0378 [Caldimonas sp.]